jgi:hypothetical protein
MTTYHLTKLTPNRPRQILSGETPAHIQYEETCHGHESVSSPELELVTEQKTTQMTTIEGKIAVLRNKRTKIQQGGGKTRIDRHHAAGLLTTHANAWKSSWTGKVSRK